MTKSQGRITKKDFWAKIRIFFGRKKSVPYLLLDLMCAPIICMSRVKQALYIKIVMITAIMIDDDFVTMMMTVMMMMMIIIDI